MYYVYFETEFGKEIFGVTERLEKATETVIGLKRNGFIAMYSKIINLDEEASS